MFIMGNEQQDRLLINQRRLRAAQGLAGPPAEEFNMICFSLPANGLLPAAT